MLIRSSVPTATARCAWSVSSWSRVRFVPSSPSAAMSHRCQRTIRRAARRRRNCSSPSSRRSRLWTRPERAAGPGQSRNRAAGLSAVHIFRLRFSTRQPRRAGPGASKCYRSLLHVAAGDHGNRKRAWFSPLKVVGHLRSRSAEWSREKSARDPAGGMGLKRLSSHPGIGSLSLSLCLSLRLTSKRSITRLACGHGRPIESRVANRESREWWSRSADW